MAVENEAMRRGAVGRSPFPSLEQHRVEVALELLHLLRHRRRRVAELVGRRDHGPRPVDGDERPESLQIDHVAIVRDQANDSELVLNP